MNLRKLPRRAAARFLVKTELCRKILIPRDGYTVRFHPASFSAGLWVYPEYGLRDEALLRAYLRAGDCYVDVGANIGTLALTAAHIAERVFAIEAHPRTFTFLQENIELNQSKNVTLLNRAVGEREGEVFFSDLPDDDQNHILRRETGIRVASVTLDSLELPPISLLKVDVEGFEKFVFLGAAQTLQRTACVYFESFAPQYARYGCEGRDVYRVLESAGLTVYRRKDRNLIPIEESHVSRQCENLLAIRDAADFRQRTGWAAA